MPASASPSPTPRRQCRDAAQQRRHRHVPRQGGRQEPLTSPSRRRCRTCCTSGCGWRPTSAGRSRARSSSSSTSRSWTWARRSLLGVEALVRWRHPEAGVLHAGALHPGGRGVRPDRQARPLGAAPGLPGPVRLAQCRSRRHGAAAGGEHLRAAPAARRPGAGRVAGAAGIGASRRATS